METKRGPGSRLTGAEVEEIATRPDPNIVHRAHLKREDFQKFGHTDRCGGCSAMLRGMKPQPHSDACRRRMEGLLQDASRIKTAKVRKDERDKKGLRGEPDEGEAALK